MYIYKDNNWKFGKIKKVNFKLEKDMQLLTEKNLKRVFWLEFVATEFQLKNLRLDTVAFDNETNSFVIIEYKRWTSYSVIDQWMTYLALLLNNKADFIQELSRKRDKFIDKNAIEWSQSRIIIIADSFNKYQKESINFKDLPIELYELKQFEKWIIVYNPIIAENTTQSIKTLTKFQTKEFKEINKEIKTYSVDNLIKKNWKQTREFYEELKDFILNLDSNLKEKVNKYYIWYKRWFQNLIWVGFYKSQIKITFVSLHKEDLTSDYKKLVENIPKSRWWWKKSQFVIKTEEDLEYAKKLIKEAYLKYNS